ncbi:MAG: amidase family protein, partial [Methylocystis sp.]
MSELTHLTLAQARDALRSKKISATELTKAHLNAMEKARVLNCYITETPELALDQARQSDARLAEGNAGPLEGLPIGVKDLYCTKGVRTTAASRILGDFTPTYESTVSSNLRQDGAISLGKLNLDEFAMGSSNE